MQHTSSSAAIFWCATHDASSPRFEKARWLGMCSQHKCASRRLFMTHQTTCITVHVHHEILARLVVRGAGSAVRQSFRLSLMNVSRQTRRNFFRLKSLRDQSAVSHPPSLPFSCDSIDWIHPFFDLCLTLRYSPVLPRTRTSLLMLLSDPGVQCSMWSFLHN